jgi:D-aminoacyl-tRNA deacylase
VDCLVYSKFDEVALTVVGSLSKTIDFELLKSGDRYRHFAGDKINLIEITEPSINAYFLDSEIHAERFIFLSKHSSSKGIVSFTSHALGNWSDSNEFGGEPKELGIASPKYMLRFLKAMDKCKSVTSIPVTYEATHHGPFLRKPSLFIEIGPINEALDGKIANMFADGAMDTLNGTDPYFDKVALGIGGNHYSEKFTAFALSGKYAFSHIMPKYHAMEHDMVEKAVKRTELPIDLAVIDWKSMKADYRNKIIEELDKIGIDYERV